MPQTSPREPSAQMRTAAGQLHELFVALIEQGFTQDQALKILGSMLASSGQAG
jgi:hypothetical protein